MVKIRDTMNEIHPLVAFAFFGFVLSLVGSEMCIRDSNYFAHNGNSLGVFTSWKTNTQVFADVRAADHNSCCNTESAV